MTINADRSVDQSGRSVGVTCYTAPASSQDLDCYPGAEGLELREDLRVDHVQVSLDLMAPGVVGGAHVLVQEQMFCGRWKPTRAEQTGQRQSVFPNLDLKVEPLHPGLVLIRVQDPLRGYVHHQHRGVLGPSRLIPGGDARLDTLLRLRVGGAGVEAPPPQLLVGTHGLHKRLRRTLQNDEDGSGLGGRADLLGSDLFKHKVSQQNPELPANQRTRDTCRTSLPSYVTLLPFFNAMMSGPMAAVPLMGKTSDERSAGEI